MKRNTILRMITAALLCASSIALAQDVQYNYDRDADFAAYKTYQWAEFQGRTTDQLLDRDIRRAVDAQLAQRGLRRVETNGDVHLAYQTALSREKQLDAWTMGPRWSGMARANTSTVEIGTLLIHMYDPTQKHVVWRGSVSKTLDIKKDPDKNYKNLEKAVAKLLRNYPPNSKK